MTPHNVMPLDAALTLRARLAEHGIAADVNDGYGLAVVSVWAGLVVWCDLEHYWWRNGSTGKHGRPVYAFHPISDPLRAAVRVARRYGQLRRPDEVGTIHGRLSCLPL